MLLRLAETVPERRPLRTVRPQRPALPPRVRAVFGPATSASFVGFTLFGVFTSVSPEFLAESLGVDDHAVSGWSSRWRSSRRPPGNWPSAGSGCGGRSPSAAPGSSPDSRCSRARCDGS